ncbi:MAG: glycosyltransferase [Bacteroidota bacterium]
MYKVSIIIPLKEWESEKLILLINSIQLFSNKYNIEIVLIYSGDSPSNLFDLHNIKTENLKIFYSEPKGIYNAFNFGLSKASGEWIMFFGGDDLVLPSFGYILSNIYSGNLNCDVLVCNVVFGKSGLFKPFKNRYGLIFRNWCQQGVIYNKKVFVDNKFDEKYPIQADHKFNIEISANSNFKIRYYDTIIAYFSTDGISQNSIDSNFWENMPKIISKNFGSFWGFICLVRRNIGMLIRKIRKII